MMDILGCETVADLQEVDIEELLTVASVVFGLSVGPERDGNYLPLDLYEEYANGAVKNIDILQGCNKDESNYFVHSMGPDTFELWAANRMTQGIAQLPDEDQELVTSFLNDAPGEQWERYSALFSQLWFNTERRMSGRFMTRKKKK